MEPDDRRRQQLRRRNDALDTDDRAIERIARWLAQQMFECDSDVPAMLEAHWTCLVRNNDHIR